MLGYYNYTVILTYVGMLSGFTGITCVIDGQYGPAVLCLMIAGICDMFDGTIASTRKRDIHEKHFGIQIDSLSDLICFGILPALLIYRMNEGNVASLFVGSAYVLCALIRLAYFNVDEVERQNKSCESRTVYRGLPVTLAALIIPAIYELGNLSLLPAAKICNLALAAMAIAFILPFKLKKPKLVGKICVFLCGGAELFVLFSGADL